MANQNNWQVATLLESHMIAADIKLLTFQLENPIPHLAGQHYSIRLTSEDGYIAERDYSLANPPEQSNIIEFGIQLLKEGEVSPYLFDLNAGEQIEVKGPIGEHFIWDATKDTRPLILIGGGSGMVPLHSMLLHHFNNYIIRDVLFFVSIRTIEQIPYKSELEKLAESHPDFKMIYTFTQVPPPNWQGFIGRINTDHFKQTFEQYLDKNPAIFICGPTPFVEVAARTMVQLGFDPKEIKTERFGG